MKQGLRPLIKDERDFSDTKVFGGVSLANIPDEFTVGTPLKIKDQGESDLCTGYALTAVSEDHEGVELDPFYQFAKTKQIMGGDPNDWGADLRSACKSAEKFGSTEMPISGITNTSRDWRNWPTMADYYAGKHKKKSYFAVDGPYDVFDNIRAKIWQHRNEKCSVLTGASWRNKWLGVKDGVIDSETDYGNQGFGHAFKIFGWKPFGEKEIVLIAQLSSGTEVGDRGLFYFPKDVVNAEFTFGNFMFHDMPSETAKWMIENKIVVGDNWLVEFYKIIKNLFR